MVLALLLSLVGCGAPPTDSVTRMDIAVQVAADGALTVTETFDVSNVSPKHGPYLTFDKKADLRDVSATLVSTSFSHAIAAGTVGSGGGSGFSSGGFGGGRGGGVGGGGGGTW